MYNLQRRREMDTCSGFTPYHSLRHQHFLLSLRHTIEATTAQCMHQTMGYAVAGPTARSIAIRRQSHLLCKYKYRSLSSSTLRSRSFLEPRLEDHGKVIRDKYSVIRDNYGQKHNQVEFLCLSQLIDVNSRSKTSRGSCPWPSWF